MLLTTNKPAITIIRQSRYLSANINNHTASVSRSGSGSRSKSEPGVGPVEEIPPTAVQPSKLTPERSMLDINENVKPIEQVIADLSRDTTTVSGTSTTSESESTLHHDKRSAESSNSSSETGAKSDSFDSQSTSSAPPPKAKKSKFWYILYHIIYWSAIGSLPVHLLMIKGEAKDLKEKQEWKIGVLTDMRDKLKRGESIEEEESLLTIGADRSKREEQVDDKYFEDLLISAEKQDFVFGKDKEIASEDPSPAPSSASASVSRVSPAGPRKPKPPKSERSYL
ncbi:hypothetical protein BX616_009023 [Lobosporangium transversale]|nr:hypothetical protein BX616_009023 [Lobosporangium transversale]